MGDSLRASKPTHSNVMLLYDFLNIVINAIISGLLKGMVQEKQSREYCRSWTVLHAQCTSALSCGFPISQGKAEDIKQLVEFRQCANTALSEKCNLRVFPFCQVVQKHKLLKVA